ncbi:MAG: hypothetical protein KJ893_06610 [Candidatus Omnitrophica bacterium]|nr:hypothetical protein [Candidatus Omnitrophota bacterium]MBU4479451.1 hypothetical protein [Candidatus Omnitrophota bacterium]
MATKGQFTGMRGVYLVAAELSKLRLIASPTSRSAIGADILATDEECKNTYSIQVKTNATTFNFWLLNKDSKKLKSPTFIYVFVNLRDKKNLTEFFIVPNCIVSEKMHIEKNGESTWYSFSYEDAKQYENNWDIFKK